MTVPGAPISTPAFLAISDDLERFKHAREVGRCLGLTATCYPSGRIDRHGRVPTCGDAFTPLCVREVVRRLEMISSFKWGGTEG